MLQKYVHRAITIKPIGWQFTIPFTTNFKDSTFNSKGEVLEDIPTNGPSLRLFSFKDSSSGSFNTYLRKDTSNFDDWKQWHDQDSK